jgi:hypothetical protein
MRAGLAAAGFVLAKLSARALTLTATTTRLMIDLLRSLKVVFLF